MTKDLKKPPVPRSVAEMPAHVGEEMVRNLKLRSMRDRYEMYLRLTEMSTDALRAFKAGLHEFFDEEDLEEARRMNDDQLAGFLFMEKAYEYMYYSREWALVLGDYKTFDVELDLWVQQVGIYPAFRAVHLRQGMYYRDFARYVNRVLLESGRFIESETQRAHEADGDLRVSAKVKRELQQEREKQVKEARYCIETALFQVVDGLYWAHWSRKLEPEAKQRIQEVFSRHGHPLIPLSRAEFRRILRTETEFLVAEIEAHNEAE